MVTDLDSAEVLRVAALAHLELTPAEQELFARQLGEILEFARRVQQIDTTGVPATSHVAPDRTPLRSDTVRPSLPRAEALGNAPDAAPEPGLFKVPRVLG